MATFSSPHPRHPSWISPRRPRTTPWTLHCHRALTQERKKAPPSKITSHPTSNTDSCLVRNLRTIDIAITAAVRPLVGFTADRPYRAVLLGFAKASRTKEGHYYYYVHCKPSLWLGRTQRQRPPDITLARRVTCLRPSSSFAPGTQCQQRAATKPRSYSVWQPIRRGQLTIMQAARLFPGDHDRSTVTQVAEPGEQPARCVWACQLQSPSSSPRSFFSPRRSGHSGQDARMDADAGWGAVGSLLGGRLWRRVSHGNQGCSGRRTWRAFLGRSSPELDADVDMCSR